MRPRPPSRSVRPGRAIPAPAEQAAHRALLREALRHHISRIANRCTVSELARPESRTALSLRLVLLADALDQSGMLGSLDDLQADAAERAVRACLKHAFRGDARQVERSLLDATALPPGDQLAFCKVLSEVGWRLFDGDARQQKPEVRAG